MNTKIKALKYGTAVALALLPSLCGASTFVCGNVSGTWTKTGSPYIATCNLTVLNGQTLTIQPGVEVIMGQGLYMDVEGTISAVGTPAEPIIIRGANSSLYWDKIYINYTGSAQSTFVNCNISDATNAVSLNIYNVTGTLSPQFANCTFSNCISHCIYGKSQGPPGCCVERQPNMDPGIVNSIFLDSTNGIHVVASGSAYGQGTANPKIANNLFEGISGSAIYLEKGAAGYFRASYPVVENNLFVQCAVALRKVDVASPPYYFNDSTGYNGFYNNQTNFIGFTPGVYGTICCQNANGTPCDVAYNIFADPLFCETTNFTLSASSPCIDAGNPASTYLDNCFTNACYQGSLGTSTNDIGIYGGPYACGWISSTGTNFTLEARLSMVVTINPSEPGSYRLEYTPTMGNTNIWTQLTNVALQTTPWSYIDWDYPAVGQRFYRAVLLP